MNKMMLKASLAAIAFIVSIPLGLQAQDEGFYPYSFARLSYVNGSVYVQRTSDLGYEKGEVNLALVQGDKMGTEIGQAEIHFGRRNYLRLDNNTKVEFAVLPTEGDERIKLHLTEGSAYLRVSHLALDKGVEVHTPDASFYVLEEGLYRFDVKLDGETQVFVREGSLEAAAEDGSVLVRSQETLTAADGRLLGDPDYAYSREDDFDGWNGSRDALLSQRSERQYLPSELEEYEEELDQNGHWVYERPYGNVWVPNVYYDDWRPYYYGRWIWYPVIGWTWVSSEPWGWTVYHYGRWNWRFGLGWYWIPRPHWGPAWVHWWHDRDYIGWCPLTWYNRPALLVNNRFYDRHDDRYFSAHNRAMTVVRRDHLQAPDVGRRQVGAGDLNRIDRVSLRPEQPSIRPAVDNARPQAIAARRALADRPGGRSEVRSLAPSRSVSPSRLRQGPAGSAAAARGRVVSPSNSGRTALERPALRSADPGGRTIRSYPSQRSAGGQERIGAPESRRSSVAAPVRGRSSESGDNTGRVLRSQERTSASPRSATVRSDPSSAGRSDSTAARERTSPASRTVRSAPDRSSTESPSRSIRTESSSSRSVGSSSRRSAESSPGRSQSRTYSSRSSVSRPSARLSSPSSSPRPATYSSRSSSSVRPSAPSYSSSRASRPSSSSSQRSYSSTGRSASPSYSRPSASRPSSSYQPRGSYSAPSRSSGSSGRSYSAPRSTGSSSGRSISAPRSGGSSSGRSGSSGRSSSSSSRSSGSSSRSGGTRKKG